MFTGLIDAIGTLDLVRTTDDGLELRVRSDYGGVTQGESIAVNGACLTVLDCGAGWFTVSAVGTTRERTTIGDWTAGKRVNLERALAVGDRFGGHLVQGHVDGVAEIVGVRQSGDVRLVDLNVPAALMPLMVPHGSIAIDGVSLTVNEMADPQAVQVMLIAHTLVHTTLGELKPGDRAHVEADVIGKYVQRFAAPYLAAAAQDLT